MIQAFSDCLLASARAARRSLRLSGMRSVYLTSAVPASGISPKSFSIRCTMYGALVSSHDCACSGVRGSMVS